MSITGSMQLVGKVEELERRMSALETEKANLLVRLDKLARDFAGFRLRAGKQKDAA
jgi:hypothetical protein